MDEQAFAAAVNAGAAAVNAAQVIFPEDVENLVRSYLTIPIELTADKAAVDHQLSVAHPIFNDYTARLVRIAVDKTLHVEYENEVPRRSMGRWKTVERTIMFLKRDEEPADPNLINWGRVSKKMKTRSQNSCEKEWNRILLDEAAQLLGVGDGMGESDSG